MVVAGVSVELLVQPPVSEEMEGHTGVTMSAGLTFEVSLNKRIARFEFCYPGGAESDAIKT